MYSREKKTLKGDARGDVRCIPGNMVPLIIGDLDNEGVAQGTHVLITQATHTISRNDYEMNLNLEIF